LAVKRAYCLENSIWKGLRSYRRGYLVVVVVVVVVAAAAAVAAAASFKTGPCVCVAGWTPK
jgi:hypothetical protein